MANGSVAALVDDLLDSLHRLGRKQDVTAHQAHFGRYILDYDDLPSMAYRVDDPL